MAQPDENGDREEDMLQAVARPGSLAEAHSILASRDGAVIIAGGTVVMPILNYGTDAFDTLVSLRGSGLAGISDRAAARRRSAR